VRDKALEQVRKDVIGSAPPHVIAPPEAVAEAQADPDLSDDDLALLAEFRGKL